MLSDAELQVWAPGADATEIRRIEQGVVALVEERSGRLFTSPATQFEWDFSPREMPTGGLSGYARGELPTLYLPEAPNVALTGTVAVSAGGTAVTGSGTAFDTELDGYVADKTSVEIEGERLLVNAVGSATSLTLTSTTPHVAGASGKAIRCDVIWMKTRSPGSLTWTASDGRYVEVGGGRGGTAVERTARSAFTLPVGDETVRLRVNFGYAEDAGPASAMLLVGEMVQEWNKRQGGKGAITRVQKSGVTVTWSAMGKRAAEFMNRALALSHPQRYAA